MILPSHFNIRLTIFHLSSKFLKLRSGKFYISTLRTKFKFSICALLEFDQIILTKPTCQIAKEHVFSPKPTTTRKGRRPPPKRNVRNRPMPLPLPMILPPLSALLPPPTQTFLSQKFFLSRFLPRPSLLVESNAPLFAHCTVLNLTCSRVCWKMHCRILELQTSSLLI